jgi:hypothetical protein
MIKIEYPSVMRKKCPFQEDKYVGSNYCRYECPCNGGMESEYIPATSKNEESITSCVYCLFDEKGDKVNEVEVEKNGYDVLNSGLTEMSYDVLDDRVYETTGIYKLLPGACIHLEDAEDDVAVTIRVARKIEIVFYTHKQFGNVLAVIFYDNGKFTILYEGKNHEIRGRVDPQVVVSCALAKVKDLFYEAYTRPFCKNLNKRLGIYLLENTKMVEAEPTEEEKCSS